MADDRVSYMYQRDPSIDRRFRPRPETRYNLFRAIAEDDNGLDEMTIQGSSQSSANSLNDASSSNSSCTNGSLELATESGASVFLRLRPTKKPCKHYNVDNNVLKVHSVENAATNNKDLTEKHYEFSKIFHNDASQTDLYKSCVSAYVENDESLTVLTYGTSGSGKTFTMYGPETSAGIIPRAITHIFTRYHDYICQYPAMKVDRGNILLVDEDNFLVEERLRAKFVGEGVKKSSFCEQFQQNIAIDHDFQPISKAGLNVFIWMSFVEIYNENVYDLLCTHATHHTTLGTKRKNLKIISNDGNAFIKDLTSVNVRTANEAFAVLQAGLDQVKFAATNINTNSSRSHCILIMNVIRFMPPDQFLILSYKFCDLAGSERLKKTENVGDRLKEAQRINTSLLVLGRCLDLLYQNQQAKTKAAAEVVPFRESKLTLLLQKPLMGREKITTIVNMMPKVEFLEENLHVLNFSSIAQKIVYKAPIKLAPIANSKQRAARSSRFSWFVNNSAPRNADDWNIIFEENNRLENENDYLKSLVAELKAELQRQHVENANKETLLRRTLVEGHEEQMKNTNAKWEKRLEFVESTYKRNNADLEAEIQMLKGKLASKHCAIEVESDDDDDNDNDYSLANNDDSGSQNSEENRFVDASAAAATINFNDEHSHHVNGYDRKENVDAIDDDDANDDDDDDDNDDDDDDDDEPQMKKRSLG